MVKSEDDTFYVKSERIDFGHGLNLNQVAAIVYFLGDLKVSALTPEQQDQAKILMAMFGQAVDRCIADYMAMYHPEVKEASYVDLNELPDHEAKKIKRRLFERDN